MGQIEPICVLMLNWIVWNRTVFEIETVLNCSKYNSSVIQLCVTNYTDTKLNCLN